MKEATCKKCEKAYPAKDKACPHCGARNPRRRRKFVGFAVAAVLVAAALVPLADVWVGHIPEAYDYNPELPQPSNVVAWADMGSGIVQAQLDRRLAAAREELEAASLDDAPEGFVIGSFAVPVDGGEITVYTIEPEGLLGAADVPAVIYNHGGAFYYPLSKGGIDSMALYAGELGARVFIPSYRTSKEAPFPTPMLDCYEAARYIGDHAEELGIDAERIVFLGDSAGGCLTEGVVQCIRDNGGPQARGMVLVFPVTDISTDYASKERYRDAAWPENANENMWDIYLADGDHGMWGYAVPNQSDDLSGLPRAYIEAAEIDVLHDEAVSFADNLIRAGVEVELYEVPGAYHGFDADQENPFVASVLERRITVMRDMLQAQTA